MAEETIMQENVEMEEIDDNELALGPILVALAAVGAAVFGGVKLFKHFSSKGAEIMEDDAARIEIVPDDVAAEDAADENTKK